MQGYYLIGSGEEYGLAVKDNEPIDEENAIKPGNIYAVTKATQNMLGGVFIQRHMAWIL